MEWKIYIKKVNQDLTLIFLALIVLIAGICVYEMQNDYAELVWNDSEDDRNYFSVFLNGEDEYVFSPQYGLDYEPDTFIRNGKDPLISILYKDFGLYQGDEKGNFIYCYESAFGFEVVGLYIKKGAHEKLFKPTKANIQKIVISKDWEEVLIITHEDEVCFDRFLKKYKKQLEDYSLVLNRGDDMDYKNAQYDIEIYYANGDMSRFFGSIGEKDFNEIRKNYHLSKNAVA